MEPGQRSRYSDWGYRAARRVKLKASPPSVSPLSKKCGSLDLSQLYRPPRFVTGIALPFTYSDIHASKTGMEIGESSY
jgi:hypothetical protein